MDKARRILFKSEEIVRKTKVGWIEADMNLNIMMYNAWKYIAPLSGVCARDFLLWVLSKVDENNTFVYSRNLYQHFINDLRKIPGSREYEENTVHIALREFLDKGLAVKLSRGVYQINPGFFMLDTSTMEVTKQLTEIQQIGEDSVPLQESEEVVVKHVSANEEPLTERSILQGGLFGFDSFVD